MFLQKKGSCWGLSNCHTACIQWVRAAINATQYCMTNISETYVNKKLLFVQLVGEGRPLIIFPSWVHVQGYLSTKGAYCWSGQELLAMLSYIWGCFWFQPWQSSISVKHISWWDIAFHCWEKQKNTSTTLFLFMIALVWSSQQSFEKPCGCA